MLAKLVSAAGLVKMGSAVGVALAGFPLRQLLSLRLVSQRLKVSLETALRLQTCAHSVTAHFHQPGGGPTTQV